jgi:hypothetical protein
MPRHKLLRLAKFTTFLLLIALWTSAAPIDARVETENGIARVKSAVPMAEAISRIKADIASKGIRFFMEIDQSKLAADAGIQLRPSTLLVFGNPPLSPTKNITINSRVPSPPKTARAGSQIGDASMPPPNNAVAMS